MHRAARTLIALLLPLALVLTGCGGHHGAPASSSSSSSDDGAGPPDPSGGPADAAPVDGSCPTSNTTAFAKTKFVLHSGLAFGAFHRWLWKPYQAGTFKKGAKGRIGAFIKGGLAALFVKREIRLASEDVKANPTLCKAIAAPLAKVGNTVKDAFDKAKKGDSSGLDDVNSTISSVSGNSAKDGVPITEDENADIASSPK